jgi:hypothetical protein
MADALDLKIMLCITFGVTLVLALKYVSYAAVFSSSFSVGFLRFPEISQTLPLTCLVYGNLN